MAKFVRVLRSGISFQNGRKLLSASSRRLSTAAQLKVIDGTNGEKIIPSPYGDVTYPEMPVSDYVWEKLHAFPDKVAVECGITGRKYTFSRMRDSANYIARSLINMGLKPGDVVALVLPNLPETPIALLGCMEAGLIVTTVNPIYTVDEISSQMLSSGCKAVITTAEIASTVITAAKSCMPPNTKIIVVDDGTSQIPTNSIPFKDLLERGKSCAHVPSRPWNFDDVAILPYSSGTTGLPKGVELTHRNLVSDMEMIKTSTDSKYWELPTETSQDVTPVILPMYHIYGLNAVTLPRLSCGSKLITLPKFTPNSYIDLLEKHKVTTFMLVPPIILFLASSNLVKRKHFQHAKLIFSGAAPISESDVNRFFNKFDLDPKEVTFCQGYGLTESSPVVFIERSGVKFSSIGKPVCGTQARLVDTNTRKDVDEPGKTGELWIRGPQVMKGYLNNEKANNETLVDGWLLTGDIAYYDEDFDFYITDRLKELIKVKGFQVAPAELEALLRTHPEVEEAAVIGIPDTRSGELPKAFIRPKNGCNPTEEFIKNFMKGKVSEYKELAGGITFVDNIPKNPSGKILRSQLKRQYVK